MATRPPWIGGLLQLHGRAVLAIAAPPLLYQAKSCRPAKRKSVRLSSDCLSLLWWCLLLSVFANVCAAQRPDSVLRSCDNDRMLRSPLHEPTRARKGLVLDSMWQVCLRRPSPSQVAAAHGMSEAGVNEQDIYRFSLTGQMWAKNLTEQNGKNMRE